MKPWEYSIPAINSLNSLKNFFTSQPELLELKENSCAFIRKEKILLISSHPGNGTTHLLQGICLKAAENRKRVLYITAQWFHFWLENAAAAQNDFINDLASFDLVSIDNIQFLHRKARKYKDLILSLSSRTKLILGCSDPEKNFTSSRHYQQNFSWEKILIKAISGREIFALLKEYALYEKSIPLALIYQISGYNGSVQQAINCLVSVRFKSRSMGIDLSLCTPEQLEQIFRISAYFPKQQFRKCFIDGLFEEEPCSYKATAREGLNSLS